MTLKRKTPRAGHGATGLDLSVDNGQAKHSALIGAWQRIGAVLARMGVPS